MEGRRDACQPILCGFSRTKNLCIIIDTRVLTMSLSMYYYLVGQPRSAAVRSLLLLRSKGGRKNNMLRPRIPSPPRYRSIRCVSEIGGLLYHRRLSVVRISFPLK